MSDLHIYVHFDGLGVAMSRLDDVHKIVVKLAKSMEKKMTRLDDKIGALTTEVGDLGTVIDSAVALIGGIADQVRAAVEAALAAGATDDQLAAMTALGATLDDKAATLAAAVAANTPAG